MVIRSLTASGDFGVGGHRPDQPDAAVVWTRDQGLVHLIDFLNARNIDLPEGWVPIDARYVSPDGSVVIGSARSPDHRIRPFRVTLPTKKPLPERESPPEEGEGTPPPTGPRDR